MSAAAPGHEDPHARAPGSAAPEGGRRGLRAMLLANLQALLGLLGTRLELLGLEAGELAAALARSAALGLLALAFAVLGIGVLSVVIGLWLWTQYGLAGLVMLAVLHLAAAVLCALAARRLWREIRPFAGSLAELDGDRELLDRYSDGASP